MKKLKKIYLLIYSSSKHQSSLNPIQFDPVDLKVNRTKTRYPNFENISDGVTQWKRIARNPGILGARLGVKKKKKNENYQNYLRISQEISFLPVTQKRPCSCTLTDHRPRKYEETGSPSLQPRKITLQRTHTKSSLDGFALTDTNTLLGIVERHWPRIIDNRDRISPESCATFIVVSLHRDERSPQEEEKKKKEEEQEKRRRRDRERKIISLRGFEHHFAHFCAT